MQVLHWLDPVSNIWRECKAYLPSLSSNTGIMGQLQRAKICKHYLNINGHIPCWHGGNQNQTQHQGIEHFRRTDGFNKNITEMDVQMTIVGGPGPGRWMINELIWEWREDHSHTASSELGSEGQYLPGTGGCWAEHSRKRAWNGQRLVRESIPCVQDTKTKESMVHEEAMELFRSRRDRTLLTKWST